MLQFFKLSMFLYKSYSVAITVIGMDRMNENSTAVFLDKPDNSPPTMVDPERETPGIIDRI